MSEPRQKSSWLMAGLLAVYGVLAVWYSVTIPLGEAPDEVPHFTVVRYLAQHGRLPTGTDEHEAWQPPLYYVLGASLTFWIEDQPEEPFTVRANAHFQPFDPRAPKNLLLHSAVEAWPYQGWALAWHLVRVLSIVLGGVTVWAVYRLGRVVFPDKPAVPLGMAALTAFTPQFLFLSAVANNDNAATALSALTLWQVAALLHDRGRRETWKRSAVLGLLMGLAVLSKASLIALLPVVGLAILVACARSKESKGRAKVGLGAVALSLAFGLAALIAGWYFVRNWQVYGDPMGWSFLRETHALREGPVTLDVLAWLFKGLYRSFWLGWIGISFDEIIYWIIGAVCLAGTAGFVVWLVKRWRVLGSETLWTLALLGFHAGVTFASLLQWTATVQGTDQGRLLYPILPTVMLVLAAGWAWWTRGRWQNPVLGVLVAGMLCLAIITPLRYIGPVHAPAAAAGEADLAAAAPLIVDWGDVRLLGYRLESDQVEAGGELVLCLYWMGMESASGDYLALIQLVNKDDQFLMYTDGSPTAGRDTTDRWTPGEPLASCHLLPVPDYGQAGLYRLTISLHPFDDEAWLPGTGPDGQLPGNRLVLPETIQLHAP